MRALLLATVMLTQPAFAVPVNVQRDDPERRILLDTVRPAVEVNVQGRVEFVVDRLVIENGWAFFAGTMQHPGGTPIECEATRFSRDCDLMDGFSVFALMRDEGRRWRLVDLMVGPTDVAWVVWPDAYGAPCSILGPSDFCE